MRHGFIRTAAVTPKIQVADTKGNGAETIRLAREAAEHGAKIIVFPELGITGYTCSDLFLQELLLKSAREELFHIARETADLDALIFVGLPWEKDGKLYNVAAALCGGHLLGLVPKLHLPNYGEFYELRHFTPGNQEVEDVWVPEETAIISILERSCCSPVRSFRDLVWLRRSARMCGFRTRQASVMRWQARRSS